MTPRFLLPLVLFAAACTDSTSPLAPGDVAPSTFVGTASGGRALQGRATWTSTAGIPVGFIIALEQPGTTAGSMKHGIYLGLTEAGPPALGRYSVRDAAGAGQGFYVGAIMDADGLTFSQCSATAGSVVITHVFNGRVRGEFMIWLSCAAAGLPIPGAPVPPPMAVSGQFDATAGAAAAPDPFAPLTGEWSLATVRDLAMPVLLEEWTEQGEDGQLRTYQSHFTEGSVRLLGDGRYEQVVTMTATEAGRVVGRARYRDQGRCEGVSARLVCQSDEYANRGFVASVRQGMLAMEHDVVGVGIPLPFSYRRR